MNRVDFQVLKVLISDEEGKVKKHDAEMNIEFREDKIIFISLTRDYHQVNLEKEI
jgi:hypothetical protein